MLGSAAAIAAGGLVVATSPADAATPGPRIGAIGIARLWGTATKSRIDPATNRRVFYPEVRTKKLYEGTAKHILNRGGVSHWTGTVPPLSNGNTVLFGHRTAAAGPLRNAHKLRIGDAITLIVGGESLAYYVSQEPFVVSASDLETVGTYGDGTKPVLTMVSCSKLNKKPTSKKYRLLIRAEAL